MKNIFSLLLIFNVLNCFTQEPLDLALSKKTKLIYEDVYQFNLKNDTWHIRDYLYELDLNESTKDSIIFVDLINKSLKSVPDKWKKDDLKNIKHIKYNYLI